jgi:hypothetical protein
MNRRDRDALRLLLAAVEFNGLSSAESCTVLPARTQRDQDHGAALREALADAGLLHRNSWAPTDAARERLKNVAPIVLGGGFNVRYRDGARRLGLRDLAAMDQINASLDPNLDPNEDDPRRA